MISTLASSEMETVSHVFFVPYLCGMRGEHRIIDVNYSFYLGLSGVNFP